MRRKELNIFIKESNSFLNRLISIGRNLIVKRKQKKELKNDWESLLYDLSSQKENIIVWNLNIGFTRSSSNKKKRNN